MNTKPPAGFYSAEGDPPETVRYWNGNEWAGAPVANLNNSLLAYHKSDLASTGRRIGAGIIDHVLWNVFYTIVVFSNTHDMTPIGTNRVLLTERTDLAAVAIYATIGSILLTLMVAFWGATPGKLLTGIRIVNHDNMATRPGLLTAFRRSTIYLIGGVLVGSGPLIAIGHIVNSIVVATDDHNQSINDRIGKTRVVNKLAVDMKIQEIRRQT